MALSSRRLHVLTAALLCSVAAWQGAAAQSLPSGGAVQAGSAHIGAPSGGNLTVQQSSQRAVVNWQNFNVGSGNSVTFQQPGANAAILNRVTGSGSTSVAGSVTANGKVYVVNPNGIQITPTGNVDAKGGFVASTLGIANQDFMAGKDKFTGNGASKSVVNQGNITTDAGGTVALIGGSVANEGTIMAPLGKVALGAGEAATLDLNGDGFLQVAVPSNATDASGKPLVSNTGKIEAAGGTVEMKAAAVANAMRDAVNMSGSIQAQSVSGHDGQVTLGADAGTATVSGNIDVSGPAEGGRIDVTGATVQLQGAQLNASGGTQGGLVRIGGQFQGGKAQDPATAQTQKYVTRFGATPALASADTTSIDAATSIKAGATTGIGGTVIVWSNTSTAELGSIDVRGGAAGGAVEVSSKNAVQSVALDSIFTGQGGSLLLDPKNIMIDDDPGDGSITFDDGTKSYVFTDDPNGNGALTLSTQDIMATLSTGTSLTLQATNDITWNSGQALASNNSVHIGDLTLDAGRSVIFNVTQLTFLGGNVTILANDTNATEIASGARDPGAAQISMLAQPGAPSGLTAMINAGYDNTSLAPTTTLTVKLLAGTGNPGDIGNLAISQAFFSDVTLSAAPGGQIQFYNQIFDVRNLTVTGSIQATATGTLSLFGDNTAVWTDPFTSTATFLNTDTVDFPNTHAISFDLSSANGAQSLIGRVTDGGDAVRLDLADAGGYTAVYGDALPRGNNLSVAIDPNSAIQSFFSGDTATSIFSKNAYSVNWSANQGSSVGSYGGSGQRGGSVIRSSANGGYLVDDSAFFTGSHTLTITPRPVTVLASDAGGYIYGQPPGNVAAVNLSQDDGASVVGILSGDTVVPVVSFSGRTGSQDMVDISGTTGNAGDYAFGVAAPGGSHTYTVTGFDGPAGGNYMVNTATSTVSANLNISPALLIPTLSAGSYTYGSPDPLVTLSGVINGDTVVPQATITGVTGTQTMNDSGGGNYAFDAHVAAGSHTYTLTGVGGADGGNYTLDLTSPTSTLDIAPKALSFTNCCGTVTSTYGTLAVPDLSLTGVLSGDDVSAAISVTGVGGAITLAARTPVGSYTVSPSGLNGAQAGNYTISGGNDFTLTINQLALNYTAPSGTVTYGTAFAGLAGISGVLWGDDVSAALGIRLGGVTNLYGNHADAGTYQTLPVLSGAQAGNYSLSGTPGSLVVNQLALNYVLHDETINYGSGALPAVDLSGILFGDDVSAAVGTNAPGGLSISTNVGTYNASVTGLGGTKAGDYTLGSGNPTSTIIINPKPLGLSSSGSTTTYGSVTAPDSFVTFTGLVTTGDAIAIHPQLTITDALGNVVTPANLNTGNLGQTIATMATNLDAGTYSVAVVLASNDPSHPASNYSLSSTTAQSITIARAPLIAVINDAPASWAYGSAAQIGLNVGFTGFASGEFGIGRLSLTDGLGNVIALGDPGVNAAGGIVAAGLDVGSYTATVTGFQPQGGAKLSNYTITSSNSVTETITPKPLTWTIANATSIFGTLASPSGTLHGIFSSDDVSISGYAATDVNNQIVALTSTLMGTSTYTISAASLSGAKAFDYSLATGGNTTGTLTVNPKTLTWSISNTSDTYGSARPLNDMGTVTISGLLPGDAVGTTTDYFGPNGTPLNPGAPVAIGMSTNAGTYQTFVTAITGNNTILHDYKIDPNAANTPGILTINPEPITATIADVTTTYGTIFGSGFLSSTMAVTQGVLYNGDQLQVDAIFPTTSVSDVGTYSLTGAAHINANYSVTVANGSLFVDPLTLKYSTPDATWVYGSQTDAIAAYSPVVSFEKDSDSSAFNLIQSDYSTSILRGGIPTILNAHSDAVSYSLEATLNNPDYTLVTADSHPGTLTITPRPVTVGVLPTVYGTMPTYIFGNILAGDSLTMVGVTATGTTSQTYDLASIWNFDGSFRGTPVPPSVDTYSVTGLLAALEGTKITNYVLTTSAFTWTVTPKPITITGMAPVTVDYGSDNVFQYDPSNPNTALTTIGDYDFGRREVLFNGQVTYSGLLVAGDANSIAPYMFPFDTQTSTTNSWVSDGGVPILGRKGGGTCTTPGCMNMNYILTNPGAFNATVVINPITLLYSIGNATTVYGSSTTVTLDLSGLSSFDDIDRNFTLSSPILAAYAPDDLVPLASYGGQVVQTRTGTNSVELTVTVGGGHLSAGTDTLDLLSLSGFSPHYTFTLGTGTPGTLKVTPKPLTYTTASATAYSGVGAIAGSLDDLGDYTLTGLLPGDQVGVILALDAGVAATSHNAVEFFPLSSAASQTPGDYGIVVTGLNGPQGSDYSVAKTGNTPGTLTAVDVFGDLNGLSFAGSSDAGDNVITAADAIRAEERNAGNIIAPTTSIDLTTITNQLTGYVVPPSSGTLANIDLNNGIGGIDPNSITPDNYLVAPPATPAPTAPATTNTSSTSTTSTVDTSVQTTASCSGGPNCTAGETITGSAGGTACAGNGEVCSDGSASYNVTNTVQPTGISLNDSVTAGDTNTATEDCGAGTCTQTAHVDVSVGASVSGGVMMTSNSVDMTEGATATAGVTFNASNGISGSVGSIDSQVGTTIGGVGASIGATSSFTNGMLNLGVSFSIDVGIGLDVNLNFGINVDAIGDAFNGTNTTYTYFADPSAAAQREDTAIRYVQNAQSLAYRENQFVQDVLSGQYNSDPSMIDFMSQSLKKEQTELMNESSQSGFSMSRNADGSFGIKDNNPPVTTSQTVHNAGILDVLGGFF